MTANFNFLPDRLPQTSAPKGLPTGFDRDVYQEVQASLEAIRAKVQVLQDEANGKAIMDKARMNWQETKNAYAQKQEDQRQATLRNVDDVFDNHHQGVVSEFRRYKAEPPAVIPSSLKPEVQAGFSAGTQQPVSFESKWSQKKEDQQPEPQKKGFFSRLWNKVSGKKTDRMPAPHTSLNSVQSKYIKTENEKAMPHWAQVALSKAKEIDESILQKVKDQSKGWVDLPPPPSVPSFAQPQTGQEQPKKGFFSRIASGASGIASKVASIF